MRLAVTIASVDRDRTINAHLPTAAGMAERLTPVNTPT
jgi:hypothetical protein